MLHFQLLQPWHWPDFLRCFLFSWLFLGVPSLTVLVGLSCYLQRVRSYWILMPVVGLIFGLATGLFNAWDDHYYWSTRAQTHWFDIFAIAGAPGDGMANAYGGDWQEDEAWHYRGDITVLNGLFWMSVGIVGMLPVRFLSRHICSSNIPTPNP